MNKVKGSLELRYSILSPYARKVRIVSHEAGIADEIKLVLTNTREEGDILAPLNPLGKIPILTIDGKVNLFDSPVICEYLDAEYGGHRLLPESGPRRWSVITLAALADGVIDSCISVRQERSKPTAQQSPDWMALQIRKIVQGLDRLESLTPSFGDQLDMCQVGVAAILGYIPLRLDDLASLERWPQLKAWYRRASEKPSINKTFPVA